MQFFVCLLAYMQHFNDFLRSPLEDMEFYFENSASMKCNAT